MHVGFHGTRIARLEHGDCIERLQCLCGQAPTAGAQIVVGLGKGARTDDPATERGVLRRQVPLWLESTDLRAIVVGFEAAHVGHGGEGALYVRIRRAR